VLAEVVRSGLVEARHDGAVAVVGADGLVASAGDVERPFYARSSIKPFQAAVALDAGAPLAGESLALACASHAGLPEHLAVVERMLRSAGLGPDDLGTPPAWPSNPEGRVALALGGVEAPSPLFHNCSGKHAAALWASVVAGFDTATYLEPDHPLQVAVAGHLAAVSGAPLPPPGVDGCGLPAHVVSATTLATAWAHLAVADAYAPLRSALRDHPVLIGEPGRVDGVLGGGGLPAKGGAEGCLGVAVPELGLGIAVKCWDGASRPLGPAIAAVLGRLGVAAPTDALSVSVLGRGRPVGTVRPLVELR
jgi:L-asparaginase II